MKLQRIDGRVLVALSGGADSVALLRLLLDSGTDLACLHCNFHLRGEESRRDELFVRQLCQELGVELHVKHFDTAPYARSKGLSIEMAARELRYAWFREMLAQLGAQHIAVAHHMDDQAETVLLNLLRGTSIRGICGMRPVNGHVIRPLLGFTRQQLLDHLSALGQPYVTDSTNNEADCQRNKLRLEVIPLLRQINPQAVRHIAQCAQRVQDHLDGKESEYDRLLAQGLTHKEVRMMLNNGKIL